MSNVTHVAQWGPTKRWSFGKYQLQWWDKSRRRNRRWAFQIGSYGSEADNPFVAAYSAWRFKSKREAEIRARQ